MILEDNVASLQSSNFEINRVSFRAPSGLADIIGRTRRRETRKRGPAGPASNRRFNKVYMHNCTLRIILGSAVALRARLSAAGEPSLYPSLYFPFLLFSFWLSTQRLTIAGRRHDVDDRLIYQEIERLAHQGRCARRKGHHNRRSPCLIVVDKRRRTAIGPRRRERFARSVSACVDNE